MRAIEEFTDDLIDMMFDNLEGQEIEEVFKDKAFLGLEDGYTAHQRLLLQSWGKVNFQGTQIDAMGVLAILQYVTDANEKAVNMIVDDSNECNYLDQDIVTDFWLANLAMQKELKEKTEMLHKQIEE